VKGRRKYSTAVREHESERFKGIAIEFISIREGCLLSGGGATLRCNY